MNRYKPMRGERRLKDPFANRPGPDFYGDNFYTHPFNDYYISDENLSAGRAPNAFNDTDDYYHEYDYQGFAPRWHIDHNNDFGLYEADRYHDYGGYGSSGYSGPYFGQPDRFRLFQIKRERELKGRYGNQMRRNHPTSRPYYQQDARNDFRRSSPPNSVPYPRESSYLQPYSDYRQRYDDYQSRPYPHPNEGAWERDAEYRRRNRW